MSHRYFWNFLEAMGLQHTWNHPTQGKNLNQHQRNNTSNSFLLSALGGEMYMESVNCGGNIAMMTFHAGIIRAVFDKLGMVAIAGPPNVGKTKELKVRHLCPRI